MLLKRTVLDKLKKWASKENRKPLLLQGARQTGKTWLMKELGKASFEHCAYFDFAARPELINIFASTRDPKVILEGLRMITDTPILPGKTLLVFDEIQLADTALGALKYFWQDAPEYAVVAGGSLLGVEVRRKNIFVPVGCIDIERILPLSFEEFLLNSQPKLFQALQEVQIEKPTPDFIIPALERELLKYQSIGGMPAAVSAYLDNQSIEEVDEILRNILGMYRLDFSQYATSTEAMRISQIWDSLPAQLAKEKTRFAYNVVAHGAKAREYKPALQWLVDAGLILEVKRVNTPNLPLKAYVEPDIFKIYASDLGLLRVLSNMSASVLFQPLESFKEFKGALAENYVALALFRQYQSEPNYWASKAQAEVDFLIQHNTSILPVEVKAGENIRGKSLGVYCKKYDPPVALRFSQRGLLHNGNVLNIPHFLAESSRRMLNESNLLPSDPFGL